MYQNQSPVPYWRLSNFYFLYFALLGVWLPFWPLYLQDRGFSALDIGYLASIVMVTRIVAPNVWGWLADYTGKSMAIVRAGSLLAIACFSILFFSDQSFWALAFLIAGYSFFWNAVLTPFEVVTLAHLGDRYRRYSQIRLWGSIGFIIAVVVLGWLFDFLSIAVLPWVVLALLIAIWLSSLTINETKRPVSQQSSDKSLLDIIKQPAVLGFLISCFLLQVSHGPYYTFFSLYLEQHGYSTAVTGLFWSLGVLAEVLLFIVMHRFLQRFSLYQIMLWSLILSVLRWLLLAYFVDSWAILMFSQCLHAASYGSFHAFSVEMVRRYFGNGMQGQGMALYSGVSYGAGGAAGAILSGLLWETDPQLTFIMAAGCCLLAIAISVLFNKYSQPSPT